MLSKIWTLQYPDKRCTVRMAIPWELAPQSIQIKNRRKAIQWQKQAALSKATTKNTFVVTVGAWPMALSCWSRGVYGKSVRRMEAGSAIPVVSYKLVQGAYLVIRLGSGAFYYSGFEIYSVRAQ